MVMRFFTCPLHGLSKMCMPQLGLLAFKGNKSEVVGILVGHLYSIGWCIVGRQAVWWERILTLHNLGTAYTSQCFSSLTYHVRDWRIYLIEA